MHAYLIVGFDKEEKEKRVSKLLANLGVLKLDFTLKKIADVRELSRFVNLSISEPSAILIEDIDQATVEAQNAFLKNLEEPQEKLIYILTARSEESVIPTISSRCQLITVAGNALEIGEEEEKKIEDFLSSSIGEKLKLTSKITKKDQAVEFLKNTIFVIHKKLHKNPSLAGQIELAIETMRRIEKNGNIQIQLTNFVVNS